jgi:hypothetical protein
MKGGGLKNLESFILEEEARRRAWKFEIGRGGDDIVVRAM